MPTDINPPDRNPLDAPTNPTSAYAGPTKVPPPDPYAGLGSCDGVRDLPSQWDADIRAAHQNAGATKVPATYHHSGGSFMQPVNTPPATPPQLTGMAARMYATFYNHGQPTRAEIADCLRVTEEFQREALAAVAPQVRYPVAPKVWAGTWGAFAAGLGIVLTTSLLDAVDVIPSAFPGQPWTAGVVALLTIVGPPVASFLRAYGAAHQARPADSVVLSPGSEVGGTERPDLEQVQR